MPTKTPASHPNNSMPITMEAMEQLVAPANTATNPIPARSAKGSGINQIRILPKVAPIKNKGVTSPPLKPALKVKLVRSNLRAKSKFPAGVRNAFEIEGMPRPINFVKLVNTINKAITIPPKNGRQGANFIFENKASNIFPEYENAKAVNPKINPATTVHDKLVKEIEGTAGIL